MPSIRPGTRPLSSVSDQGRRRRPFGRRVQRHPEHERRACGHRLIVPCAESYRGRFSLSRPPVSRPLSQAHYAMPRVRTVSHTRVRCGDAHRRAAEMRRAVAEAKAPRDAGAARRRAMYIARRKLHSHAPARRAARRGVAGACGCSLAAHAQRRRAGPSHRPARLRRSASLGHT